MLNVVILFSWQSWLEFTLTWILMSGRQILCFSAALYMYSLSCWTFCWHQSIHLCPWIWFTAEWFDLISTWICPFHPIYAPLPRLLFTDLHVLQALQCVKMFTRLLLKQLQLWDAAYTVAPKNNPVISNSMRYNEAGGAGETVCELKWGRWMQVFGKTRGSGRCNLAH